MRRRDLIKLISFGTAIWPLATRAQQSERMRRVGVLMPFPENDAEAQKSVAAFVRGLREGGWTEGSNVQIEYRWAGTDAVHIRSAAAELVELKPDAIIAVTPLGLAPLQQMTSTIPIVFLQISDPVSSGFVTNLAKPDGNITGFTTSEFSMSGKMLQEFKKFVPAVNRVIVVYNPVQVPQVGRLAAIQAAGPPLGVRVDAVAAGDADKIIHAIEGASDDPGTGMIVLPNPITIANRRLIIERMARHRLAAAYELPVFAREGGLMSYGTDPVVQWHDAGSYVDRILRGAKTADLPIQQPTKFELTINLTTAKALGLSIPESLLATADEVIE
jgi:putative tryptophan/tyrosine transport system substrate-binding protein